MRLSVPLALLLALLSGCDSGEPSPDALSCTVSGAPGITYTTDRGASVAQNAEGDAPSTSVSGLAALDSGVLFAAVDGTIYRSADEGCTWSLTGETGDPVTLTAAGTTAYGWYENAGTIYRIDAAGTVTAHSTPAEGGGVIGLAFDRVDPDHVRIAASWGQLYESADGGASWTELGGAPGGDGNGTRISYRVAFDPSDWDHVLYAAYELQPGWPGLWLSDDAGQTWTAATGIAPSGARGLVTEVAFAPANPDVVWAFGSPTAPGADERERLYRSEDGGRTFETAHLPSDNVFTNQPLYLASPDDEDVLYWADGLSLHRYDHDAGAVTTTTGNTLYNALLASPQRSGLIYIGADNGIIID